MSMNMNQQQPVPLAGLATNQAATQGAVTEGSAETRDEEGAVITAKAPAAPMSDEEIGIGIPVSDVHGETIGIVARYDEQQGQLVVRGGWLFGQDTTLPADSIGDRGASGIYLTQSKDELLQQYGGGTAAPGTQPAEMPNAETGQ